MAHLSISLTAFPSCSKWHYLSLPPEVNVEQYHQIIGAAALLILS